MAHPMRQVGSKGVARGSRRKPSRRTAFTCSESEGGKGALGGDPVFRREPLDNPPSTHYKLILSAPTINDFAENAPAAGAGGLGTVIRFALQGPVGHESEAGGFFGR